MDAKTVEFDLAGRRMTLTGGHEAYLDSLIGDQTDHPLLKLMRGLPQPATCLDVGANIGVTSLMMASRGRGDRVIAFEPVPGNAVFLKQNLLINGVENCTVIESAVGDVPGSVQMAPNGPWSMIGTKSDSQAVPVTTLDDWYAANLDGTCIDLIKIDVEGYEPNVLAGAARVIERWRPIIFMEFNSWTLILQGYNPISFAGALLDAFDATFADGRAITDPQMLVHDNMVHSRCVDDLILRPRSGARMATADEVRFGTSGVKSGQELAAVYASTSWRITAPLRALKTAMFGR